MSSEILNQAEIDALLQMIGGEGALADPWQPGEEKALEELSRLLSEALGRAMSAAWGGGLTIEPAGFALVNADDGTSALGGGIALEAGLSSGGRVVFLLTGAVFSRITERATGRVQPVSALGEKDADGVSRVAGALLEPVSESLGGLAGGSVRLEAVSHLVAGPDDLASLLKGLEEDIVRFAFRCRGAGYASEDILLFWPLAHLRAFLGALGQAEPSAAGGHAARKEQLPGGASHAPASREQHGPGLEAFQSIGPSSSKQASPSNIEFLLDVPLVLTVELGRTHRPIKEIINLAAGSVIELERLAGEPVDVMVNGKLIARGEVVVVDDKFGVRIVDIVSRAERLNKLR